MGHCATDWDITTPALPEVISKIFTDYKKIEFGQQHGTIAVKSGENYYEITTYRIDGTYTDGRRPDKVSFTPNLFDDLKRRDFTVNAMAYSPSMGLVDPFKGADDIASGIIRCVGNATERFAEDYLRILRAYRFSATLNFTLEQSTHQAANNGRHNLEKIAYERIGSEVSKILTSDNHNAISIFLTDCADVIFPALHALTGITQNNAHHIYDAYTHTMHVLKNTPPTLHQRLAAIFHDTGKALTHTIDNAGKDSFKGHAEHSVKIATPALSKLCFDNATKTKVIALIKHHMQAIPTSKIEIKKLISKVGAETLDEILIFQKADNSAKSDLATARLPKIDYARTLLAQVIKDAEPAQIKDLALTGQDIMHILSITPSPTVGLHLQTLLDAVIENPTLNTPEVLTGILRKTSK